MTTLENNRPFPYILITAGFLILLILLTNRLGDSPLLTINGDTRIGGGWTAVTNSERDYTVNIPRSWPVEDTLVDEYAQMNTAVNDTVALFAEGDPDLALSFVTYGKEFMEGQPVNGLALYRSQRLNQLNPTELAAFAVANIPQFQLVSLINRPWHTPQVHFVSDNSSDAITHVCEMRFAPGTDGVASILVLCTMRSRYPILRDEISTILNSYQELK